MTTRTTTPVFAPTIASVTVSPGQITLGWTAPIYEAFAVQWTTNLPPVWNTFSGYATSLDGNFIFIDDGSQSGGLLVPHYYRLLLLP